MATLTSLMALPTRSSTEKWSTSYFKCRVWRVPLIKKIVLLLSVLYFQFLPTLKAELVRCEAPALASSQPAFFLSIKEKSSQAGAIVGIKYLWADITYVYNYGSAKAGETFKQGDVFVLQRLNKQNELEYRDSRKGNFLLSLDTTEVTGIDVPAKLFLYPERSLFKKTLNLKCNISGKVFGPLFQCPVNDKLDEALIQAAKTGSPEEIELLLDCGARVNYKDALGCTPFLYASDWACGVKIQPHLPFPPSSSNASPTVMRQPRYSFLEEVVDLLIDNGANYDAKDPATGETPLIKFVKFTELNVLQSLIELEANINAQDKNGMTALMYAADQGKEILIKILLRGNPNLSLKNQEGLTAYDLAKKRHYDELLELLEVPKMIITIVGSEEGVCSPNSIEVQKDIPFQLTLKATTHSMFKMDSPALGIDLMAPRGGVAQKVFTAVRVGSYSFTCGVHGGSVQTAGVIMVK
jgi:hypothetical protein